MERAYAIVIALSVAGCFDEPPDAVAEQEGSSGVDDDEGSETTGESPPVVGVPECVDYGEPCTECEVQACPDLFCECYGNPDCGLVTQCVLLCPVGDIECQSGCASTYPGGTSASALLADCAALDCEAECTYLGTLPPPLTGCERCLYSACGEQMDTCFGAPGCPEILACLATCGVDATCQASCGALYPAGVAAAQIVGDCSLPNCTEACL